MIYEAGVAPHGSAARIPTRVWETLMGESEAENGPQDWEGEGPGCVPTQESLLPPASVFSAFKWGQGENGSYLSAPCWPRCSVIPNLGLGHAPHRKSIAHTLLLGTGVCEHFFSPARAGDWTTIIIAAAATFHTPTKD